MYSITAQGNILFIDNHKVTFSYNIYQIKSDNEKVYILLDIPYKSQLDYNDFHNIYCYSIHGQKLWQIGNRPQGDHAVYTMINIDSSFLYASDFLGRRYSVDKNTGKIKNMMISK